LIEEEGSALAAKPGLAEGGCALRPNARIAEFGTRLHWRSSPRLRCLHGRKREGTARVPMLFAGEYARNDTGCDQRCDRAEKSTHQPAAQLGRKTQNAKLGMQLPSRGHADLPLSISTPINTANR